MSHQHAGLSQVLAEQHISQRRERAAQARLAHGARQRRRRTVRVITGCWQPARRPAVAVKQACTCLWWQVLAPVLRLHVG